MRESLIRLDQIAGRLNAWLLAIALGVGMLDFTVFVVKSVPLLPAPPSAFGVDSSGPGLSHPPSIPGSRG